MAGKIFQSAIVVGLIAALSAGQAGAQTLPGAAQPGRLEQALTSTALIPQSTSAAAASDQQTAEVGETGATFVLNRIDISGSTVFSDDQLRAVYSTYLGSSIDASVVFEIAADLTAHYRNNGYILSQVIVPPQEIDGGVIKLQAIEGYVDELVINGTLGSKRGLVDAYLQNILDERPLRSLTLEHYLLLAGDLAGIKVESVFSPSATNTGAATLTVNTTHDWFEGSFAVSNYGSDAVGPHLADLQLVLNSVFGMHERVAIKFGVAAELEELQLGELYAALPVGEHGTNIFGSYAHSHSNPGGTIAALNVDSRSNRYTIGVKHPFIRSRKENLFADLAFHWDDLTSTAPALGTVSDDHLRVVRIGAEYDFVDTIIGSPAVTAMRGVVSVGLNGFGATTLAAANPSRVAADGQFTSFLGDIQRTQKLGNSGFSLVVAARGQFAGESLLASEELGFGGQDFGRGYDPSQITGDRGILVKGELQYHGDPAIFSNALDAWALYAFMDYGIVENVNFDGLGNNSSQSLWSAGVGTRFGMGDKLDVDLALAYRGSPTTSVQNLGPNQWRLLGRAEAHF